MVTDIERVINIDALAEEDAIRVLSAMCDKFGWAATLFTREDVEGLLEQSDPEAPPVTINEFTDEQWADFSSNKDWHRYVPEWMAEKGWDVIQDILDDWLKEKGLS
jgi:hypothetical protein